MTTTTKKTFKMDWSVDSNAFMLMGTFDKLARKAGWTKEQISEVIEECKAGDYDHLVQTIMKNTQ